MRLRSYGPYGLKALQNVFDSVWDQMRDHPALSSVDTHALRQQISRKVFECVVSDGIDVHHIECEVMSAFLPCIFQQSLTFAQPGGER